MIFKKVLLSAALGLVVAALAVPTVLAKPVSGDVLNGGYDPWAYSLVYQSTHPMDLGPLDPWAYSLVYQSKHPVNLGPLDPWAYALVHRSDATPAVTASSQSTFDFGDAAIGAAVSFGIALILLGMVGLGLKYRRIHRSGLAVS
jgi:hypothetical protein